MSVLRFGIPSKGSLYDGTIEFLAGCGLKVTRANPRRYTASIRTLPEAEVLLHRPHDIVHKVAEGSIDIGISGLDLVQELRGDDAELLVLFDDLGFGRAELVLAAPETWVDVNAWQDLADLSVEWHREGRALRIATKFPALVRRYCYAHGINYFALIDSQGATEAAPGLGYADIIADVTETGTTLRDNQLKIIGSPILRSQACLIANRRVLRADLTKLELVRSVLELVEARRRARLFYSVMANVQGRSVEEVGRQIAQRPEFSGVQGPTIAPVWDKAFDPENMDAGFVTRQPHWFAVTVVIPQEQMLPTIAHLRAIGANGLTVVPVQYVFGASSEAFDRLLSALT
jgi:ATP phosphoribosyltransferase